MGIYNRLIWSAILIFSNVIAVSTPAFAESKSFNFTLSADNNQTFNSLIEQAESLASNLIEQGFAESPSITEVAVTVVVERYGQEAPLLLSKVSRSQWEKEPTIKIWSRYFQNSAVLLGFFNRQGNQTTAYNSRGNYRPIESSIEDDPGFRDD